MQAELERAVRDLLWSEEARETDSAWSSHDRDGWSLYRELAREKLVSSLAQLLERTAAALGSHFEREVSEFLAERGAGERQLHRVAASFVAHAAERWQRDASLPPYLAELARHEALELELESHPGQARTVKNIPLTLDAALAFDPTCRVLRYEHAVQHGDDDERAAPERRETRLLVFRDAEHALCWIELDPACALLLEELLAGRALGACIENVRSQIQDDGSFVLRSVHVLGELAEQGALVGPCAAVD